MRPNASGSASNLVAGFHEAVITRAAGVERSARKRHDLQVQSWTTLQRAEARLIGGDFQEARSDLASIEDILSSLGKPERIWATGLGAFLHLRMGELNTARDFLQRGIGLIVGGPPVHSYCVGACDRLAQTAIEMLQQETTPLAKRQTSAFAHKACSVLERAARVFPNARPGALLHRGSLDLIRRRQAPDAVLRHWRRGVTLSDELGLPYHELRLRSAISRHVGTHDGENLRRASELRAQLRIDPTTML